MRGEEQSVHDESRVTSHESRISVIVAVAKNDIIGVDNRIPWHLPAELKLFKEATMGCPIVMGRRTFESIGRLLPGRTNVVVTRQRDYVVPGAVMAHSLDEALAACGSAPEVFVIGGAALFSEALPRAQKLHHTVVDIAPAGDTIMPTIDWSQWREIAAREHQPDEKNPLAFRYAVYERVKK